jgi:hypothetical protein
VIASDELADHCICRSSICSDAESCIAEISYGVDAYLSCHKRCETAGVPAETPGLNSSLRYLFSPVCELSRKDGARKPRRICTNVQFPDRTVCSHSPDTKKECYNFYSCGGVRMCLLMWLLLAAQAFLGWYMNGVDIGVTASVEGNMSQWHFFHNRSQVNCSRI